MALKNIYLAKQERKESLKNMETLEDEESKKVA